MNRVTTIVTSILACYGAYCAVHSLFDGQEIPPGLVLILIIAFSVYLIQKDPLALAVGLAVIISIGVVSDGMTWRGVVAILVLFVVICGLYFGIKHNGKISE